MYAGETVQGITLQRLTDTLDKGVVLARAWHRSVPHSYVRTRDAALFAGSGLVAKVCAELHAGAGGQVLAAPSSSTAPLRSAPGRWQTANFAIRVAYRKLRAAWSTWFGHGVWNVGLLDVPIHELLGMSEAPRARWMQTPDIAGRGAIRADPFGVTRHDSIVFLYEQADSPEGRGRIVSATWPATGDPTPTGVAFDRPTHLSYPFLLMHAGTTYCLPESGSTKEVVLYRAVEFPTQWARQATLVAGVALLDATLVRWDGLWWLFGATKAGRERGELLELHAWYARDLTGPYLAHAGNPVKADVRSTRPAGTPFVHEGRLYRPAQDCSVEYGGAVAFCRIDRLGPAEFSETVVSTLRPNRADGYPLGLHTVSACGAQTLIDGKRRTWIPRETWRRITRSRRPRRSCDSA
jgi:hypothetical protein